MPIASVRLPGSFVLLALLVAVGAPLSAAAAPATSDRLTVAGCSLPNHSLWETLEQVHALGFGGVELATFADNEKTNAPDSYPWVVVDQLSPADRSRLKALVGRFRHVSIHLPYGKKMRPIARDPAIRDASRRELRRSLDDGAFLGAELANIHVLTEEGMTFAEAKPELVALYRELGDYAGQRGMRLAIETTRPYRAAEYLALVAEVGHPNVGGCVDTGHTHFFEELSVKRGDRVSPESVRAYNDLLLHLVSQLGPKLFHLHLDDVRRIDWREHFVPGEGIIDWPRLFSKLAEMRYSRLLVLELLYYVGARDEGASIMRAFTQRTPDGAPAAGLAASRRYLSDLVAKLPPAP